VVVLAALAYVAVLHFTYVQYIAPFFGYLRYIYRSPDPLAYALVIALVLALALVLPRRISQPSHLIAWSCSSSRSSPRWSSRRSRLR
jgi:hypothetical protein